MRFYKSCDTLTTIQLGEKTQLTKVVSALKRFGDPLQARWDNRDFWDFLGPRRGPCAEPLRGSRGWFLSQKLRLSQRACRGSPNLFRGETTLVSCVFSPSWIVVKVSQLLKNRIFWLFLGGPGWGGSPPPWIPPKKSKNAIFQKLRYFDHNPTRQKDATY